MNKTKICEALYALPNAVVERRKRPNTLYIILFFIGLALIIANNLFADELTKSVRVLFSTFGTLTLVTSGLLLASNLKNRQGIPHLSKTGEPLHYRELYFEMQQHEDIIRTIERGDVARLLLLKKTKIPSIVVMVYHSEDHRFAAMQAFQYKDYEYQAITDLRIVNP